MVRPTFCRFTGQLTDGADMPADPTGEVREHNSLMRWAVPPAMIVKEIRAAVQHRITLIVDGGISDGFDAFKALAPGADAVSIGKPLMEPLEKKGAEGVSETIRQFTDELKAMMVRTGISDMKHMDASVIHPMNW